MLVMTLITAAAPAVPYGRLAAHRRKRGRCSSKRSASPPTSKVISPRCRQMHAAGHRAFKRGTSRSAAKPRASIFRRGRASTSRSRCGRSRREQFGAGRVPRLRRRQAGDDRVAILGKRLGTLGSHGAELIRRFAASRFWSWTVILKPAPRRLAARCPPRFPRPMKP